ncbi:hypothetical protein ACTHGU_01895 [Chitinophagaceae bacterium MMS25-I14]
MKSTVGVYDTHEKAIEAIQELQKAHFPTKHVSLIGQAEMKDDHMHIKTVNPGKVAATEVGIGAVLGPVLGALVGAGVFAIPGLGFLFGAGALVGAIAGFDFGLIGGGIVSALTMLGIGTDRAKAYDAYLQQGKFILIVQGSPDELAKAKEIIEAHGGHIEVETHGA